MKMLKHFKITKTQSPQNEKPSKRDTNIKGGGIFRFQIGLLVGLVASYFLMESVFAVSDSSSEIEFPTIKEEKTYVMPNFEIEEDPKKEIEKPKQKTTTNEDELKVIEDDAKLDAKKEFINKSEDTEIVGVDDIINVEPVVDVGPINVAEVEFVPVFPGCETLDSNDERRECMSDKINRIVKKNFDASIASEYGLTGLLRIDVQFKIDKQGKVSDVKVRAPHKILEKEAERVTRLIPQMQPGKQGNQNVEVVFLKPIIFKVQ
ncbi:energy transducer TonB [Galbibacter sp. EGI 63066]|uniref:energy transducer TonB n=1 Tax=Galbibacter sp. EGI 63066 TaxID=2993559 RepID=UPI00224953D5|nr:energy transducer TonB [Galbibacter sp. EGI 63066]MCX2681798.1 energy transducer TonB [Galbibacter sp. EGI 63066]